MCADGNLSADIPAPTTLRLGTEEYTLSPLTPYDFAQAETWIRNERLEAFLEQTRLIRGINLPDKVRGDAIGAIMSAPVALGEVLDSFNGQLYLVFLSMKKTCPELILGAMKEIPPMDIFDLSRMVREITGIKTEEEETEDDPLETNGKTSTREKLPMTFQGGSDT